MLYQTHNSVGSRYFEAILYDNFNYVIHMHRFPEMIYVLDGEVEITLNDQTEVVKRGDFALVPGNMAHGYSTRVASKVWVGVFSDDYVSSFERLHRQYSTTAVFHCDASTHAYLTEHLVLQVHHTDLELSACLYTACAAFEQQATWVNRSQQCEGLIQKIVLYISENFRNDISLASMAAALGYEPHYLSRQFNAAFPGGLRPFVNRYRVDVAKELLCAGNDSIAEIGFACGFQSIRSFNRAFKILCGTTPRAFTEQKNATM